MPLLACHFQNQGAWAGPGQVLWSAGTVAAQTLDIMHELDICQNKCTHMIQPILASLPSRNKETNTYDGTEVRLMHYVN